MPKTNAFSWRYKEPELQEQVAGYSSMKWTKTARGQCVIFFSCLIAFSLAITAIINLPVASFIEVLAEALVLYAPLLFFVYKGHRWAVIGLMIVWAGDKSYGLYYQFTTGGSIFTIVIFLILGIGVCMRALQVENMRRKPSSTAAN